MQKVCQLVQAITDVEELCRFGNLDFVVFKGDKEGSYSQKLKICFIEQETLLNQQNIDKLDGEVEGLLNAAKSMRHFYKPFDEYFAHIGGDFDVGCSFHGGGKVRVKSEIFLKQMVLDFGMIDLEVIFLGFRSRHILFIRLKWLDPQVGQIISKLTVGFDLLGMIFGRERFDFVEALLLIFLGFGFGRMILHRGIYSVSF